MQRDLAYCIYLHTKRAYISSSKVTIIPSFRIVALITHPLVITELEGSLPSFSMPLTTADTQLTWQYIFHCHLFAARVRVSSAAVKYRLNFTTCV
jgi:hypothetical protein